MINVLIIVQNLPVPFDRRVWQEAGTLCRAGFRVTVVCPKSHMYSQGHEQLEGIEIYRYPLPFEAKHGVLAYCIEFVYCWFATLLCALRIYLQQPFQLIHACNPPDTYFAMALLFRPLGVRFVFDCHDLCPDLYVAKGYKRSGVIYYLLLLLEWLTLHAADAVIVTNGSYRFIVTTRGGVGANKVEVVRSAPHRSWSEGHAPDHRLKQGNKYLVVFEGQIAEQDGIDWLLRAVKLYRTRYANDTQFVIIGDGPMRCEMQRLASTLGVIECTEFTGRLGDAELCRYLATADVCVEPAPRSEFNDVSTMNKIVEYMAFGCPIVAFDLLENRGSAREAARYVEPENISRFANEIRDLLENELARQQMSQFAKKRFEEVLAWHCSEEYLLRAYDCALKVRRPVFAQGQSPRADSRLGNAVRR